MHSGVRYASAIPNVCTSAFVRLTRPASLRRCAFTRRVQEDGVEAVSGVFWSDADLFVLEQQSRCSIGEPQHAAACMLRAVYSLWKEAYM